MEPVYCAYNYISVAFSIQWDYSLVSPLNVRIDIFIHEKFIARLSMSFIYYPYAFDSRAPLLIKLIEGISRSDIFDGMVFAYICICIIFIIREYKFLFMTGRFIYLRNIRGVCFIYKDNIFWWVLLFFYFNLFIWIKRDALYKLSDYYRL